MAIAVNFGRRNFLRLAAGGAAACFADALWLEPNWLQITRREIRMPGWPPVLDGLRVGLAADLHFRGQARDFDLLGELVRKANAEALDLMVMPGDFIDSDAGLVPALAEILRGLTAQHGVFGALGNHDGWNADPGMIRKKFGRAGIPILVNESHLVSIRGQTVAICGTDSVWAGVPDPKKMLQGVASDVPVIALVHEPDFFDEMKSIRPGVLQVSGHTHGGQCRVPLVGIAPVLPRFGRKYPYGIYEAGESRLFVTRGVGTTGLRVRFACPPELAVLTLRCG